MITLSVLYPRTAGSSFNLDYYLQKHIPLVKERFGHTGLTAVSLLEGTGTLEGGSPHFAMIALLHFGSIDDVRNSIEKHGAEVVGDIPNFTGVQPVLQLNQPL
jgi:uncharacterized protein (TIGR02118 family)